MDDLLLVQILESCDQLMEEHQGGLQGELATAVFHKVFDCGTEKLRHDVVTIQSLTVSPADVLRDAIVLDNLQKVNLFSHLRTVVCLFTLDLDGDEFLRIILILAYEDEAKGPTADSLLTCVSVQEYVF